MLTLSLGSYFEGSFAIAAGASLGIEHFQRLSDRVAGAQLVGEQVVALDLGGITDATPSYLKATVLALHQAGRLHAEALTIPEQQELPPLRPLSVIPVLLCADPAVNEAVHELFARRGLAILSGSSFTDGLLMDATLLGELEPAVLRTLELAGGFKEFQAADLHKREPNILVTGWNNRLAELHRQRLVRRRTEGRTHRFFPIVSSFSVYGKVLPR